MVEKYFGFRQQLWEYEFSRGITLLVLQDKYAVIKYSDKKLLTVLLRLMHGEGGRQEK